MLHALHPELYHTLLGTLFIGVEHPVSSTEIPIHQYRGIKYASVSTRFRPSKLFATYPRRTDATKYGPICPQRRLKKSLEEELFGLSEVDIPHEAFKQNEFECLNMNITCPAGIDSHSRLPVMVWIHGGGDRGTGSSWVYDGAALVRKSVLLRKPVIVVSLNFRLGLFGFAASPTIQSDNKASGNSGVGNYGLRDQRVALEWIHHYIVGFGGDPSNVTLFGESSGAADILSHLLSAENETRPLFHRAIIQSAVIDFNVPNVSSAGWQLSRIMSALQVSNLDELRALEAEKLLPYGHLLRVVDDGVFLRQCWRDAIAPSDAHHNHHRLDELNHLSEALARPGHLTPHAHTPGHTPGHKSVRTSVVSTPLRSGGSTPVLHLPHNLQPLIIGDGTADSLLWSLPASMWTAPAVVRRLKAVCQSLSRASHFLHAYDISSYTPEDEITGRVLDLINDARIAWPTECVAQGAKMARGGHGVWRYVFDQEGPVRGMPHHAADLIYLFDNVPLPACSQSSECSADFYDGPFDVDDEEEMDVKFEPICLDNDDRFEEDDAWGMTSPVNEWSYARVRDTIQERWIAFANGEAPWDEDKVFVFGPEGETGERSRSIFEGRRHKAMWRDVLEPLGMQLVQKVGVELSRGPPLS
ncbi:Carboxylic ester hydrolase [Pleurotus pulmonarius]